MSWLYPTALFALLLVPVALLLYVQAGRKRREALRLFFGKGRDPHADGTLAGQDHIGTSPRRRRYQAALFVATLALLGLAWAGPRYGTQLRESKQESLDLVIALDVSLSMLAEDVAPSRLARAKYEISSLLSELSGDRVGLVLFAGDAFLQCPLTTDYSAVRLFLDAAVPSVIPTPGTDLPRALRVSYRAFETRGTQAEATDARAQAVLLISDGENHLDGLERMVDQADERGIRLFAAGVGEKEGATIPLREYGGLTSLHRDRQGNTVRTRLEEAALKEIGGAGYVRLARQSGRLTDLMPRFERLEKTTLAVDPYETYAERYQWPLALGLLCLVIALAFPLRRKPRPAVA